MVVLGGGGVLMSEVPLYRARPPTSAAFSFILFLALNGFNLRFGWDLEQFLGSIAFRDFKCLGLHQRFIYIPRFVH